MTSGDYVDVLQCDTLAKLQREHRDKVGLVAQLKKALFMTSGEEGW